MTNHETNETTTPIEPGSDSSFGMIVGGILLAIGAYQYFKGFSAYYWIAGPGAVLILLGMLVPRVLHPLNIAWTRLGILLGRIVTPLVMFLVFVVSIIPIGLILRAIGKDSLRLKPSSEQASYWIERTPPGPTPESLKDQF